ncbi:hypothetical protein EXS73_00835 [Candidatus Pacearchaeota archaeon]|nr:hypothetical protein [Candidatus Pacearchaeota archaeon]
MGDLTGTRDIVVAPIVDRENRVFGLSLPACDRLLALRQKTFGQATCFWNPEWPHLVLVGFQDYEQNRQDRFRGTDFNLPDYLSFP